MFANVLSKLSWALDWLKAPLALGTRIYVSWVFFTSGLFKINDWEQTTSLFADFYKVPILPPLFAAVLGTFSELFIPVLVTLGLAGRASSLALFAVNLVAVISYPDLFTEGYEAALGEHIRWGFMLLMLTVYGPGALSVDRWLESRRKDGLKWT